MRVVGHRWEVVTAAQAAAGRSTVVEGGGVGGTMEGRERPLPAGEAFRVRGLLTASAPSANLRGHFVIRLEGDSAADEAHGEAPFEAHVGALGVSTDGEGVRDWSAGAPGPSE